MFTLKLYRRVNGQKVSLAVAAHRVVAIEVPSSRDQSDPGSKAKLLELQAYGSDQNNDWTTYFVGEDPKSPNSLIDPNGMGNYSLWGWGLLENWEGNTSEHYRPASYG